MDYVVVLLIINFIFYCGYGYFVKCEIFNVFGFEYSFMNFSIVIILVRNSILFLLRIVIFNYFRIE